MFKTQLSFTLLFKSNVVTVRRAAVRALHTLLLARNMTAVVRPSSAPCHDTHLLQQHISIVSPG